jgi:uncharacterized membrane protein
MIVAASEQPLPRDVGLTNNTRAFHNLLVAQADLPPPVPRGYEYTGWTRGQLQQEYDRLDASKPGLGSPISLLIIGGGLTTLGVGLFFYALASLSSAGYAVVFFLGAACALIPGVILLIIGAVSLPARIRERNEIGAKQDLIRARMDTAPPDGPPGFGPPPPPPPGAQHLNAVPLIALYSF